MNEKNSFRKGFVNGVTFVNQSVKNAMTIFLRGKNQNDKKNKIGKRIPFNRNDFYHTKMDQLVPESVT